jgi:hypothetical protein
MSLERLAACATVFLLVSTVKAADQPELKPGIWKETMIETPKGGKAEPTRNFQKCLDAAWIARSKNLDIEFKKTCSKYEVHEVKGKWIEDSVCKPAEKTKTQHAEISWVGDHAYHKELDDTITPSATGTNQFHIVLEGVWLGPCQTK